MPVFRLFPWFSIFQLTNANPDAHSHHLRPESVQRSGRHEELICQQRAVLWQQSPPPPQLNNLVCKEETEIVRYVMLSLLTVFRLQRLFIRSDL